MKIVFQPTPYFDPTRQSAAAREQAAAAEAQQAGTGAQNAHAAAEQSPRTIDSLDDALSALQDVSSMARTKTQDMGDVHAGLTLDRVMELLS